MTNEEMKNFKKEVENYCLEKKYIQFDDSGNIRMDINFFKNEVVELYKDLSIYLLAIENISEGKLLEETPWSKDLLKEEINFMKKAFDLIK